jgi:MFS family permease
VTDDEIPVVKPLPRVGGGVGEGLVPSAVPPSRRPAPFSSLRHRNFRLFIIGQFISLCGTWIQGVAQGWLVFQLSDSALQVGLVSTLGSLPVLLFTLYGGVVADRVQKHRFILILQGAMLLPVLVAGVLVQMDQISVPIIMGLAVIVGTISAFEVPARQAFVVEIAGKDNLMNAIALNSSIFNLSRIIGPAIAAVLITAFGVAACFYVNAASYLAVIVGLRMMKLSSAPRPEVPGGVGSFAEGMRFVLGQPWPRALVILTGTLSVFGFAFIALLPVFAHDALGVEAAGYGGLLSAIGVGALGAALFVAGFGYRLERQQTILVAGVLFGISLTAGAFVGSYFLAIILMMVAGTAMVLNNVLTNTLLQTSAPDHLRGRVMGVYSFLILGLSPFGSLQAGYVAEYLGVRTAYAAGGIVCIVVALGLAWHMRRYREGS